MEHLKTTAVIRATKKVVVRLNYLVLQTLRPRMLALRGGGGANTGVAVLPPARGIIRVFLSSFMVAYRTESTMANEDGELEAAVISAAHRLLACFDCMCNWLVDAPPNGGGGVYATMPEVLVSFVFTWCVGV